MEEQKEERKKLTREVKDLRKMIEVLEKSFEKVKDTMEGVHIRSQIMSANSYSDSLISRLKYYDTLIKEEERRTELNSVFTNINDSMKPELCSYVLVIAHCGEVGRAYYNKRGEFISEADSDVGDKIRCWMQLDDDGKVMRVKDLKK